MAINLQNLFNRLGKIVGAFRTLNGAVGAGPPSPSAAWGSGPSGMSGSNIRCLDTVLQNIQGQLQSPFPELLAGQGYGVDTPLYRLQTSLPSAISESQTYLQKLAQGLIIDTVNADVSIPDLTIATAVRELIRQMVSQSSTIHSNGVSSTTTAGSGNTGNPAIVVSLVDSHGKNLEYAYRESLILTTTLDQFDDGTAGSETISIVAPVGAVSPSLNYQWPSGNGYCSGFSGSLTVVDPTLSNGSEDGGNLLNNSSFKGTWTTSQPQYWTTDVGSPVTNWQDGTTNKYAGTDHCFQFIGDGSTLSSIYQTFANQDITGGNTSTLEPETVYLFCARVKMSTASFATGVLTFSITDSSGNVLADDAGTACTVSYDLKGVGNASYNAVTGAIRLPSAMPATELRFRMKLTQAIPSGKNVFVDYMALTQPSAQTYGGLYTGGPYIAAFRGSADTVDFGPNPTVGDRWTVAITNDYGGLWQTLLWQILDLPSIGVPIPSAAAGFSIAETAIS